MSANRSFVVAKHGNPQTFLAPSGFKHPIWQKEVGEAIVFHSRIDAIKAAKTHGGEVTPLSFR